MESGSEKSFINFLKTEHVSISFEKCVFVGGLRFSGCEFSHITFKHCQFTASPRSGEVRSYESLSISNCNFDKLFLQNCIFDNKIIVYGTHCQNIEIEKTIAPWVHVAGMTHQEDCNLKIEHFSGGTIVFNSEKRFKSITCDKTSINTLENGAGVVQVFI